MIFILFLSKNSNLFTSSAPRRLEELILFYYGGRQILVSF